MTAALRGVLATVCVAALAALACPAASAAHGTQPPPSAAHGTQPPPSAADGTQPPPSAAHGTQPPPSAAHDTQPPALITPVKARFVVGSQIGQFRDSQERNAFYDVAMRLSWKATDNADTELNYDVWEYPQGAEPNRIGNFITDTTFDVVGSDYDGFFGGAPNVIDRWGVQAYDDAGNSMARTIFGAHLFVRQDDPTLHTIGTEAPTKAKGLRYIGDWAVARCTCFADKTTHHTQTAGNAVAMTIDVADDEDVSRVALVMDQGPGHGKARIRIDGELRATVDTLAATAVHRGFVWTTSLRPGTHTIRVVNLATKGRARIDFDAVIVN